jgi:hypothetical protein
MLNRALCDRYTNFVTVGMGKGAERNELRITRRMNTEQVTAYSKYLYSIDLIFMAKVIISSCS